MEILFLPAWQKTLLWLRKCPDLPFYNCDMCLLAQLQGPARPFFSATFRLPNPYISLVLPVQAPQPTPSSYLTSWQLLQFPSYSLTFLLFEYPPRAWLILLWMSPSHSLLWYLSSPVLWSKQWALNKEMFSKLEKKVFVSFHLETVHLISIYNNSFHNAHLHFKRLLDFQEHLSSCSGIGRESTPASNQDFVPSVIITVWGHSFIGFQNEMGLLYIVCTKSPWIRKTVWGQKVVYDY